MATYALIHGAGDASYWHLLVPEQRARGHEVLAPELPSDAEAGLAGYTETVVSAIVWWVNTGSEEARRENVDREGRSPVFDLVSGFFHDVPPEVTAAAMSGEQRAESAAAWTDPWPLDAWPSVPTRFLLCRNDRFFPASFMRRVVRDRLGITPTRSTAATCPH